MVIIKLSNRIMKIELRELMADNEMLSHIFLGCIPRDKILTIRDKYLKDTDGKDKNWKEESVKIPVEMKIGGVAVNPKAFFDSWKNQMQDMITKAAKREAAEMLGSGKMHEFINKMNDMSTIIEGWEKEINWDIKNPLIETATST